MKRFVLFLLVCILFYNLNTPESFATWEDKPPITSPDNPNNIIK